MPLIEPPVLLTPYIFDNAMKKVSYNKRLTNLAKIVRIIKAFRSKEDFFPIEIKLFFWQRMFFVSPPTNQVKWGAMKHER
jgi:hypothetical protein